MKKLFTAATLQQKIAHRRKWADYTRVRRKPTKTCRGCGQTHPNDGAHFTRGQTGWLTSLCLACSAPEPEPPAEPAPCMICNTTQPLVRDRQAPHPTYLCRRCLAAVNMLKDPGVISRLYDYAIGVRSMPIRLK
jgi:hypothetical protein